MTPIDEAADRIRTMMLEQLARLKDELDREAYLTAVFVVCNELWDTRKKHDTARG